MALTVFIKDLVVTGRHGVHQHEKETPQRFKITIVLDMPDSKASVSDDLADTVDYLRLRDDIVRIVEDKTYELLERLAAEIAARALEDKHVSRAVVTVDKLDAFDSGVPGVRLEVAQATS